MNQEIQNPMYGESSKRSLQPNVELVNTDQYSVYMARTINSLTRRTDPIDIQFGNIGKLQDHIADCPCN